MEKPQGTKQFHRQIKAYENMRFLESKDARALRMLAEYLEPLSRFKRYGVRDTIVFMGSARLISRQMAEAALAEAEKVGRGVAAARTALSRRQDPADPLSLGDVKPGKALFGKVLLFRRLKLGGLIKRTDMKMRFRRPWESFASQS